jgi:hypothetical protein
MDVSGGGENTEIACEPNTKGTMVVTGNGGLDWSEILYVGQYGVGTFQQQGGTTYGHGITVGYWEGSSGHLLLQGGSMASSDYVYIGYGGEGTFEMTGGTFQCDYLFTGFGSEETATLTLTGGTFQCYGLYVGAESGTATLTVGKDAIADVSGTLALSDYGNCRMEIELASLSDYSFIGSTSDVFLGTDNTLDVQCLAGFRPKHYDAFPIFECDPYYVNGDFGTYTSNITLGLHGDPAFYQDSNNKKIIFDGFTGGDCNGDDAVDISDLTILGTYWNQTGKTWAQADFNGDTTVDISDLTIMGSNWGWHYGDSMTVGSPCPPLVDRDGDGDFDIDDVHIILDEAANGGDQQSSRVGRPGFGLQSVLAIGCCLLPMGLVRFRRR